MPERQDQGCRNSPQINQIKEKEKFEKIKWALKMQNKLLGSRKA